MLMRSSSTPVLGSLLSHSETPNRDFDNNSSNNNNNKHLSGSDHSLKKISFSHGGHPHFSAFSCSSSPISHPVVTFSDLDREPGSANSRSFRRARSDSNLEGLAAASCDLDDHKTKPLSRASRRPSMSVLETIPSYSVYSSRDGSEIEDEDEEEKEEDIANPDELLGMGRSITIGDFIAAVGSGEFSFGRNSNMDLIEEEEAGLEVGDEKKLVNPPLYLARGIGIDVGGLGGGAGGGGRYGAGGFRPDRFGEGGRKEESQIEEYYKKRVEENPCSPLFLRNYAQFLYQSKGDLQGAEEYYSRAILVDPTDGEIMSQYAELLWKLYHDKERASSYFERAVQTAPEDNHVLAAYANFLWETEDEEQESLQQDFADMPAYHVV